MKKITYLFSAIAVTAVMFTACKKKDNGDGAKPAEIQVTQVQNALVVEPTATWCGPCGQSGKPASDLAITGNSKVAMIYAHINNLPVPSDLASQCGHDFGVMYGAASADRTGYSIPKIGVGNKVTGAYADINYTANILKGWINETTAGVSKANTKIDASISGDDLTVKTNTKFFEKGVDGSTYKLSVVLTEDNIYNRQNVGGTYQMITHNHVSRATISKETIGDDLMTGTPASGQVISKDFTLKLNSAWKKSDLTVIAIIWKSDAGKLTFINVDKIDL